MHKTEAPSSSEFRDWAHLLPEIIELISSKVKSTTDYVRFRAVCSPWRSASYPKPRHHLPPQLPWLMLPNNSWDPPCVYFDDIWESKRRKFHLPEAKDMVYLASYRGWFLVTDFSKRKVFLLNPLTRARIQLPSFDGRVKCLGDDKFCDIFYHHSCNFKGTKMTFSANLTDPNCLITVLLGRYDVFCCRVGDLYWTCLTYWTSVTYHAGLTTLTDATYYDRRFYLLCEESLTIIESEKPEKMIVPMPELKDVRKCFLEGKTGVFVLVVRPEEKFELYQLIEESLMLKQITDTSNNTSIFYGDTYSCVTVCADDWDSLDGGFVYTENKCVQNASQCAVGSHYIIYFAQWDGQKIEHMVRDLGKEPQFGEGEPVMWFQPSFV